MNKHTLARKYAHNLRLYSKELHMITDNHVQTVAQLIADKLNGIYNDEEFMQLLHQSCKTYCETIKSTTEEISKPCLTISIK